MILSELAHYSFPVLNHILTFAIFFIIGIEIRDGLSHVRAVILPTLAALGGMIFPALIFLVLAQEKSAWAVVMPTDVALAIGALSLLGSRVNPAVKLFLMTLAIADDFFSLVVIGIFYRSNLDISSAFYTIGAALIGALLPYRNLAMKYLAPVITFAVIPTYIWINLFSVIDLSTFASRTSLSIVLSRVIGKVLGITLTTYLLVRWSKISLPPGLKIKEVAGIGLLSGMGMTVSLVIAEIAISDPIVHSEIRSGLFLAAILSGLLGVLWLKRFPAAL
jgi:NhaA family Na+:H+ antiporter